MSKRARCGLPYGRPVPGQTLVICALLFSVLLGALGLALDGGYNYIQRRSMQNAADSASFAGAEAISRNLTDTQVTAAALAAAARNGVTDPNNVTCTFITNAYSDTSTGTTQACSSGGVAMASFGANYTGVLVRTAEQHQTFVFRALGITQSGTAATAAARVQHPIGITSGPFMVCGMNTVVVNPTTANYTGGIYNQNGYYPMNRSLGQDDCQGSACPKASVENGPPVVNNGAYAFDGANLAPIINSSTGNPITGPIYLIHAPNGINPCNDNSSSFKGINTNAMTFPGISFPAYPYSGYQLPPITTGTVASVSTSVNGLNGCQAGATIDNCIMILPVCDDSGPGGTGSNAALAVRSLEAFYVNQTSTNTHTGQLLKNYNIQANSDPTFVVGSGGVTAIKLIK